ncbi:PEGA domain-containing protein [Methanofollis formosanus]|uniref:PEGA domain-containing protein n=1 Tax=Methanofollis formosanus TaxID=299308 RepID=A0A8G1A136_9EURY|nr:PEGA domain-containing protein [Methanofollis formosanus]QYZ78491.1 PEGA domain-containing protein [Methanofollis formosanus]
MKGMHRAATRILVVTALFLLLAPLITVPVSAATTEVTITKLANDDETVLDQKTVTWEWMRDNLPVKGDGETMYYTQGPIFEGAWEDVHPGEPYDAWNPTEDVNLEYKDHGEFMGTDVMDLCDLVGGADPEEDTITIKAKDGLKKTWPADYVYNPNPRQGPMVIAWYHGKDIGTVGEDFRQGMRLYFLGETTNEAGMHVWGNWDMHESWDEEYWYYYQGTYPSASGVSVQMVSDIIIHSEIDPDQGGSSSGDGGSSRPRGLEGAELTRTLHGTVNGSVALIRTAGETQTIEAGETARFSLNTTGLENVETARLYLFGTNNTAKGDAKREDISAHLDSQRLSLTNYYADRGPNGDSPAVETWCYDLPATLPRGIRSLEVKSDGPAETSLTLYGGVLFAVVRDDHRGISYWVAEGADAVEADPSAGVDEEAATSKAWFPDEIPRDGAIDARVFSVATGASGNDTSTNCLTFQDGEWMNLLDAGEENISIGEAEVTSYLKSSDNTLAVFSVSYDERGDYLENRLAVLVVGTREEEPTPEPPTVQTTAPPTVQTTSSPPPTTIQDREVEVETAEEEGFWSGFFGWLHNLPLVGALFPAPTAVTAPPEPTPTPAIEPVSTPAPSLPASAPLNIITYPAGAQVVLDGEYLGMITPARFEGLSTGTHSLELALEGYRPYETTFDLTGETDVTVALESASPNINVDPACLDRLAAQGTDLRSGGVYVDATDEGATIYIDSKKIEGTTPQVVNGLKEGRHKVKVKKGKAEYRVDTREVWVIPGTIVPVYFDRYEQSMTRTVTLDAPAFKGEYCAVNGHPTGKKMPAKVKVPVLNAFASVFHDGAYLSVPIPTYAGDGETVLLKEMPGLTTLMVDSKPAGAEIFIDGFDTGHATPYLIENVSYGRHGVMVTKPGYLPKEDEVLIPKGTDDRSVTFNLETYAHGALYVNSTSAGAKIYLYGLNTGEVTPHLFTGMDLGKYTVKVVGRSDSDTVEDVMVVPDRMATCEVRLKE